MSKKKTITRTEAIVELKRELKMRECVYPGQIRRGKLTKAKANSQYLALQKALELIEAEVGVQQKMFT